MARPEESRTGPEPPDGITVFVAWALPGHQAVVPVKVPLGAGARRVVLSAAESGLLARLAGLPGAPDPATAPLAIYGIAVADDHPVGEGDRIELLRPLLLDPREARRLVAARGGTMGTSGPGRS